METTSPVSVWDLSNLHQLPYSITRMVLFMVLLVQRLPRKKRISNRRQASTEDIHQTLVIIRTMYKGLTG